MTIDEVDRNIGKTIRVQMPKFEGDTIFSIIIRERYKGSNLHWENASGERSYNKDGSPWVNASHRDCFTLVFQEAKTRYKNF